MSRSTKDKVADALLERHPLQRIESPSRTLSAAVHVFGLASFYSSFRYLIDHPNLIALTISNPFTNKALTNPNTRSNNSYGWHLQYLTILGLSFATATFALALLADLTLARWLFTAKNILSIASTPIEILVSLLYWTLHTIDPALVVPPDLPSLPLAVDLGFHAVPSVLLIFDCVFLSPPWGIKVGPAAALSTALSVAYWAWVERCYARNGFYPYPIFEAVQGPGRVALFAGSAAVTTLCTVGLKWLYGRVNGVDVGAGKA